MTMFRPLIYSLVRTWQQLLHGVRLFFQALLSPVRWAGAMLRQLAVWWSRRETRYLLRGLPALVVFSAAGWLLIAGRLRSDAVLAETYLGAARHAEATNKPEVAALLLERVVRLRPADDETLFELATMAQQAGDQARAAVLIRQLAPDDGQGYAPAHVQVGRYYLNRLHLATGNFERAQTHLSHALTLDPDNPTAHALLGQLYFSRGAWDPAITELEGALEAAQSGARDLPEELYAVRLLLAKAYSFRGRTEEAARLGRAVRQHYAEQLAANPRGNVQSRIILADACMFLEDFDAAAQTLNEGLVLHDQDPALRSALARFNVAWSDALLRTGRGSRTERFELLSAALLLDPNYVMIFDRMMGILKEGDDTAADAREFLLKNVTEGKATGLSHLLLGSAAFQERDLEAAAYHLERARALLPNALIVANNLAWFLAFRDPPDLQRAEDLINSVLQTAPNDPRFLDTRGQIYAKQGRWNEAIADLERALDAGLPGAETHLALALCYESKGLPDLAAYHSRLAESEAP